MHPITQETGYGDLIIGTVNPNNPHEVQIDRAVLATRHETLNQFAQGCLWNPAAEEKAKEDIFAIGMECGQYSLNLEEMLAFAASIGCQTIQVSPNQVDLAKAATDYAYRLKVWAAFERAKFPFTSMSMHCDTYSALAIMDNSRAGMFTPSDVKDKLFGSSTASQLHLNKLVLMIIGAAQFGLEVLHLFWGMPKDIKPYGWAPQKPAEVQAMRELFVQLVSPLIILAKKLGVNLCHEIHFGTIAMNADDLIEIWVMLGKPDNFCVGIDPSHFWHGETWLQAMDKLRKAGMKVVIAHAKNAVVRPGRPLLSLEMDDRLRGEAFTFLDDPHGIVSMPEYLGALTVSGMVEFWFSRGLPVPIHVEAENPFFRIDEISAKGVEYLRRLTDGLRLPTGHFTDAMSRGEKIPATANTQATLKLDSAVAKQPTPPSFTERESLAAFQAGRSDDGPE